MQKGRRVGLCLIYQLYNIDIQTGSSPQIEHGTFLVTTVIILEILPVSGNARTESTHLILILSLDEEGQSKSHLGQLCDLDAVFRTVELWGVVILVD